ncbi:acyl carrier protein [Candidatus Parcubacteria bacterium]|nr:MAG: acyl carrier protein [Candidatus Parcubacteria bacterium]
MSVKDELQDYLVREVLVYHDKKTVDPDEDLLTQGVIDSMGILQLVEFIEKEFGIEVNDDEIVPENFRTLNCLTGFVSKKADGQLA